MDAARPTAAPRTTAGRIRRGAHRALTVGVLVPAVALAIAAPAYADVTAVQGAARGLDVGLTLDPPLLPPVTINVGPLPESTIPGTGGTDSDNLASLATPPLGGVGVLNTSTTGSTGAGGTVTSSASVADVNLTGTLVNLATADVVSSQCTSNETGSTGSSTITNLQVLGQTVTADGSANQQVTVTVPLVGTVTVHLNEQIVTGTPPSSSITVNAVRLEVNLLNSLASGEVIIAQSVCGVTGDGAQVPTGAIGGVLLTGLAAVGFVGFQLSRRRRAQGAAGA